MPTVVANIPQLAAVNGITPSANFNNILGFYKSMTARNNVKLAFGTSHVGMTMKLPANLLSRQSEPMLRTNLSVAGRDLYTADVLNTLLAATYTAQASRVPIGGYLYKMHFRVAGRINPSQPTELARSVPALMPLVQKMMGALPLEDEP